MYHVPMGRAHNESSMSKLDDAKRVAIYIYGQPNCCLSEWTVALAVFDQQRWSDEDLSTVTIYKRQEGL